MFTTAGAARWTASAYDQASWPGNSSTGAAPSEVGAAPVSVTAPAAGTRGFSSAGLASGPGILLGAAAAGGGAATPTSWGRQATTMKARARPLTTDAAMNINTRPIRLIPAS